MEGHSRVRLPVFTAAALLDLFPLPQKARGDGLMCRQVPGRPRDAIGAAHLGRSFCFYPVCSCLCREGGGMSQLRADLQWSDKTAGWGIEIVRGRLVEEGKSNSSEVGFYPLSRLRYSVPSPSWQCSSLRINRLIQEV